MLFSISNYQFQTHPIAILEFSDAASGAARKDDRVLQGEGPADNADDQQNAEAGEMGHTGDKLSKFDESEN